MEDIFKGSHNPEGKKSQAQRLRDSGLSYTQIGEKLGVSKQYISKILNSPKESKESTSVNQTSTNSNEIVNQDLSQCRSVADLKTWIDTNLLTKGEFEHIKVAIEEAINKRLGYFQKQLNEEKGCTPQI